MASVGHVTHNKMDLGARISHFPFFFLSLHQNKEFCPYEQKTDFIVTLGFGP